MSCILMSPLLELTPSITEPVHAVQPAAHAFDISRAHIISMAPDSEQTQELARNIRHFLHIANTTVFHAVNGTEAILSNDALERLTFYTRYLMLSGRHDHMQLSNAGMLGCFLSHTQIWKSIQPNETVAIFEDDAYIDLVSAERMHMLSRDVERLGLAWDVLLLESGHNLIASGEWVSLGNLAATCLYQPGSGQACTWFGTRGYLINYRGSQHLLRFASPISVQVDALIGLVAAFSPDFRMIWTRKDIARLRLFYTTGVWDACFKCYLPASPYPYVLALLALIAFTCHYLSRFSTWALKRALAR
jgi:GR25 family glycosyltransferase involved in LPS biosynthesis